MIHQLKKWQPPAPDRVHIWDSPPGTSCPVVESIRGADFLLLVTEPTPFGLHDLRLAAQLGAELEIPIGVVINRAGVGNSQVEEFCQESGLPILMRIPLEREIGAGIAQGIPLIEIQPAYTERFVGMFAEIQGMCAEVRP